MSRRAIRSNVGKVPFDCWCEILNFSGTFETFIHLSQVIKGFYEYTKFVGFPFAQFIPNKEFLEGGSVEQNWVVIMGRVKILCLNFEKTERDQKTLLCDNTFRQMMTYFPNVDKLTVVANLEKPKSKSIILGEVPKSRIAIGAENSIFSKHMKELKLEYRIYDQNKVDFVLYTNSFPELRSLSIINRERRRNITDKMSCLTAQLYLREILFTDKKISFYEKNAKICGDSFSMKEEDYEQCKKRRQRLKEMINSERNFSVWKDDLKNTKLEKLTLSRFNMILDDGTSKRFSETLTTVDIEHAVIPFPYLGGVFNLKKLRLNRVGSLMIFRYTYPLKLEEVEIFWSRFEDENMEYRTGGTTLDNKVIKKRSFAGLNRVLKTVVLWNDDMANSEFLLGYAQNSLTKLSLSRFLVDRSDDEKKKVDKTPFEVCPYKILEDLTVRSMSCPVEVRFGMGEGKKMKNLSVLLYRGRGVPWNIKINNINILKHSLVKLVITYSVLSGNRRSTGSDVSVLGKKEEREKGEDEEDEKEYKSHLIFENSEEINENTLIIENFTSLETLKVSDYFPPLFRISQCPNLIGITLERFVSRLPYNNNNNNHIELSDLPELSYLRLEGDVSQYVHFDARTSLIELSLRECKSVPSVGTKRLIIDECFGNILSQTINNTNIPTKHLRVKLGYDDGVPRSLGLGFEEVMKHIDLLELEVERLEDIHPDIFGRPGNNDNEDHRFENLKVLVKVRGGKGEEIFRYDEGKGEHSFVSVLRSKWDD